MFRIGEFSRIAQVSNRLLRYYDEIGLLSPEYTDPQTGYRSYSARQLPHQYTRPRYPDRTPRRLSGGFLVSGFVYDVEAGRLDQVGAPVLPREELSTRI